MNARRSRASENVRKPREGRFWLSEEDKRSILSALLGKLPPKGGFDIHEIVGIVAETAPRPVSKATVYRLLQDAGWRRDWNWRKLEGGRSKLLLCSCLRQYVETLRGEAASHATVYRYMRRQGWTPNPVWRPSKRGSPGKSTRGP